MIKLTKEKRNHLILVAMCTTGVIAGLWFGLITMQQDKIKQIARKTKATQEQIDKVQKVVAEAAQVNEGLKLSGARLSQIESSMATGDLFSWIVTAIKQFNVPGYKVEMPQFGTPVIRPVTMLAGFPYQQASMSVAGTAYFDDFGKFLAEFENHFPYMRVQNLSLEPVGSNPGATAEERERLSFHMEIVALIKSNTP
ncbi:MAG TPA: hypothetical protein VFC07_03935 [Verrucomicrobiae bacterium]|nr:hypothetical protein [Verrucomicrobiae bacterium]